MSSLCCHECLHHDMLWRLCLKYSLKHRAKRRKGCRRTSNNSNIFISIILIIIISNSSCRINWYILSSTGFLCALHSLRKVASMGAIRWTNSKDGKRFNSMKSKILPIKTGKRRHFLMLFLWTSTMIWMKREGKNMEPPVMRAYREIHHL